MGSYWISTKLLEDADFRAITICKTCDKIFNENKLLEMEQSLIMTFEGRIYRPYLYARTYNRDGMMEAFELLRQYQRYPSIDLKAWSNKYGNQVKSEEMFGTSDDDHRFGVFYRRTVFAEKVKDKDGLSQLYTKECLYTA